MSQPEFPKKIADNVTMYAADPIVYLVSDFLNDDECEAFISAAQGNLRAQRSSAKINLLNTRAELQKTVGSNMMPMK